MLIVGLERCSRIWGLWNDLLQHPQMHTPGRKDLHSFSWKLSHFPARNTATTQWDRRAGRRSFGQPRSEIPAWEGRDTKALDCFCLISFWQYFSMHTGTQNQHFTSGPRCGCHLLKIVLDKIRAINHNKCLVLHANHTFRDYKLQI